MLLPRVVAPVSADQVLLLLLPPFVVLVPVQVSPPAMNTLAALVVLVGGISSCELQKMSVPLLLAKVMCPVAGVSVGELPQTTV